MTDCSRRWGRTLILAALVVCATATVGTAAAAQSATFRGRVLVDSTEVPLAGAVVAIESLKLGTTSDSLGNFVLNGIAPGAHAVVVRKVGFAPLATVLRFGGETVEADLLLAPTVQALPDVKVETSPRPNAKMMEFEERMHTRAGGHFITQAEFEKEESHLTSDVLRKVPGLDLMRDSNNGSAFYVAGGRMQSKGPAFGGSAAARCFAEVVLDGAFVYRGLSREPLFDINSVDPAHIAGLEFYASPATIPVQYAGNPNTCGLVVIWTR